MRSAMVGALAVALIALGCSGSGLSGTYLTAPGYGFEFDGDTVYSMAGETIGRGTYTVAGADVRVCFSFMCADLRIDGDCLDGADGGRYCKGGE